VLICTEYTGMKTSWKFGCRNYLRWGWVFLEQTRILSEMHCTRHFIELVVVETKQFVGSDVNAILTCQTCGQRLIRAAV